GRQVPVDRLAAEPAPWDDGLTGPQFLELILAVTLLDPIAVVTAQAERRVPKRELDGLKTEVGAAEAWLLEPRPDRLGRRLVAEWLKVNLADRVRAVAGAREAVRERDGVVIRPGADVESAVPADLLPGEDRHARGRADGVGAVGAVEEDALRGE